MLNVMSRTDTGAIPAAATTGIWSVLVIGSAVFFSLALACATPFAALATVTGFRMARRDALILVALAWLANQFVGYLILGYPQTWDSFGWGAVIGIAAASATFVASKSPRWPRAMVGSIVFAFLGAFLAYEGTLFAATVILPSSEEAFSLPIVMRIFEINGLAFAGLLVLHRFSTMLAVVIPMQVGKLVGHRA